MCWQNFRHSHLCRKHGNAAEAQKRHLPFEMRGNSAYSGFDCNIDIPVQTIQFYSTIHKDKDERLSVQKEEIKDRLSKLREDAEKSKDATNKEYMDDYIAAQISMETDIFTTCTWMVEGSGEWELFVYFVFPASNAALLLTHKCALSFKGSRNWHGTTIPVAINKTTKQVRLITDGDESVGVVRAWGKGGK
jgi:hypothetical protein